MSEMTRRDGLKLLAAGAALGAGCARPEAPAETKSEEAPVTQAPPAQPRPDVVQGTVKLGFPWATRDPFLFCVYHRDEYPAGNERLGPAASLAGRNLGMDFQLKDGWRMYHGRVVPGFPQHPHRGFETVTVVNQGLIDHADSLGAAARYGDGDVQWLTAGAGIQHAEMFPLLRKDGKNVNDFFQIWLNLPASNKMVDPHFSMLWAPSIPRFEVADAAGKVTRVKVVAGAYQGRQAPPPPPNSWASMTGSDVAIWTVSIPAGGRWTLPAAKAGLNRSLYYFAGAGLTVNERAVPVDHRLDLRSDQPAELIAADAPVELLLLEGRPIGEPVAQHGPFVMNTRAELQQAYADYRRTQFGGWPWPNSDPVHGDKHERFAKRPDGSVERPG